MRLWLAVALLATLQACALTVSPRALLPIEGMVPLDSDARIWVEEGYEAYGERVAAALPDAIARVEAAHYRAFLSAPRVHVCGSSDCYLRYVLTPKTSAAVIPDNRLVLSPNLDGRESQRLPFVLTHELAHLHLGQRIGHFHTSVPVWFHEGWASLTAEGGGAEFASDDQVYAAIREGRRVNLTLRDTYDSRHRALASKLGMHAFYRQSMMLVGWLKAHDEMRFRELVLAIQDNADFDIAFWNVYGRAPVTEFSAFFDAVLGDNPITQAAPAQPQADLP